MDRKRLRRGFALLEILYWLTYGSFATYLVSFVIDARGGSASLSGLILALFMLGACVGQFVIGGLCDRRENNRRVYMIGMGLVILIQLCVFFAPNMYLMAAGCVVLGFTLPPIGVVVDTWLLHTFHDEPNAFAPLRAFASLAYAGLMLFMGWSIQRVGHAVMPAVSALFALLAIAVAYRMPEIPHIVTSSGDQTARRTMRSLNPIIWVLFVCMAILGCANNPLLNMNLLILQNIGGTVAHAGVATSFNTLAEFIVMRFFTPILRVPSSKRMLLSSALYVISTIMMILTPSPWLLYAASFINGVAYGIFLPARRQFASENSPADMHNRVNNTVDLCYMNLGGLIGNQSSGLIIDHAGVRAMLTVCLSLQVIGGGLLTVLHAMRSRPAANAKGR